MQQFSNTYTRAKILTGKVPFGPQYIDEFNPGED